MKKFREVINEKKKYSPTADAVSDTLAKHNIPHAIEKSKNNHYKIKWSLPGKQPRMYFASSTTANQVAVHRAKGDVHRMLKQDGMALSEVELLNQPKNPDEEHEYLEGYKVGKHISTHPDTGHAIHKTHINGATVYSAFNPHTKKVDMRVTGFENKGHKNSKILSSLNLSGREGSALKAHKFYSHLINHHNLVLHADTSHTHGGMKVWQKLHKEPGVHVHSWHNNEPSHIADKIRHGRTHQTYRGKSDTKAAYGTLVAHKADKDISEALRSPERATKLIDRFSNRYPRKPEGHLDPEDRNKRFTTPLIRQTRFDPDRHFGVPDNAKLKNIDISKVRSTQDVIEPDKVKGMITTGIHRLPHPSGYMTKDKTVDVADGHHRIAAARALGMKKIKMKVALESFRNVINESQWMYHGSSNKNLNSLEPNRHDYMLDRAIGSHFAADPNVSRRFAAGSNKTPMGGKLPEPGKVYKTKVPSRSKLDVVHQKNYRNKQTGKVYGRGSDQAAIGAHIAHTVFSQPEHKELFKSWAMRARNIDEPTADKLHSHLMAGKSPSHESFGMAKSNKNSFRSYVSNFDSGMHMMGDEDKHKLVGHYLNHMQKQGKEGLVYKNTSPMETGNDNHLTDKVRSTKSYVIFHPQKLKLQSDG